MTAVPTPSSRELASSVTLPQCNESSWSADLGPASLARCRDARPTSDVTTRGARRVVVGPGVDAGGVRADASTAGGAARCRPLGDRRQLHRRGRRSGVAPRGHDRLVGPATTRLRSTSCAAIRRSAIRRSELWNGNRQSLVVLSPWSIARLVHRSPEYSKRIARTLTELAIDEEHVVHLESDAAVDRWLGGWT